MPCQHQKKLYQLMEQTGIKLAGPDIIRITCSQCGEVEVCPAVHLDEYERLEDERSQRPLPNPDPRED
jgi:hypothetical protein